MTDSKKYYVVFQPREVPEAGDDSVLDEAIISSDHEIAKLSAERMMSDDENVDEVVVGQITITDVAVRSSVRWTKPKKGEDKE